MDALVTRRHLLKSTAQGFGWLALSSLLAQDRPALAAPHFRPRAKNVIFCFMDGGVSHVDSFDPKPKLTELDGRPFNDSRNPTARGNRQWLRSPWAFRRHGQSGLPVSELFPHIAKCADDLALVRSMKADLPLHSTGVLFLHTGANAAGRPSLGAWTSYGLGSENRNLPDFVVLSFGVVPCGGLENFSSGFLPANHQATLFHADGAPLENLHLTCAETGRHLEQVKAVGDKLGLGPVRARRGFRKPNLDSSAIRTPRSAEASAMPP